MTPAQQIAASLCWLARWHGHTGSVNLDKARELHPTVCGFCKVPLDDLMARMTDDPPHPQALIEFRRLPPGARFARIREAQEVEWWTALPSPE